MIFNRYVFWLFLISLLRWGLERLRPWRPAQKALRPEIAQDFFWLAFNGHFAGVLLAYVAGSVLALAERGLGLGWLHSVEDVRLQPASLGFEGMESFPRSLPARLVYPFWQPTR